MPCCFALPCSLADHAYELPYCFTPLLVVSLETFKPLPCCAILHCSLADCAYQLPFCFTPPMLFNPSTLNRLPCRSAMPCSLADRAYELQRRAEALQEREGAAVCDRGVQTIDSAVGIPNFSEWGGGDCRVPQKTDGVCEGAALCDKGVQTIDSAVGIPNFSEWGCNEGSYLMCIEGQRCATRGCRRLAAQWAVPTSMSGGAMRGVTLYASRGSDVRQGGADDWQHSGQSRLR